MKIKMISIEERYIDINEERKRINDLDFTEDQKRRLSEICDLFEQKKFQECIDSVRSWGRSEKDGCREVEFLNSDIYDVLVRFHTTDDEIIIEDL